MRGCRQDLGLALWLMLLLGGCAALPFGAGSTKQFSVYAETVFRHQNQVSSRWMLLSDADLLPDNAELTKAEDDMEAACDLLNNYAEQESDGKQMSWRYQAQVQASVKSCEASASRLERLLDLFSSPHDSLSELK
jgi:hypothetical protein